MRLINLLLVGLLIVSCKKDKPEPCNIDTIPKGMIVLCEGLFQQNNSSLSYINKQGEVNNSFFVSMSQRQLGDTGNDMKRYGDKLYVVVNVSSTIEVVQSSDVSKIKQISMVQGGTAKQPRSIAFDQGKAFIACFDGYVDVLDTTSLSITQRIQVGTNPEDLTVANGKLYVSNSGGLNSPLMDSTVSVIDLSTMQEISKITVGLNPGEIITDQEGDVYVITRGNYSSIPSRMVRIDSQTDNVVDQFNFDVSGIAKMNDKFLVSYYDYSSTQNSVGLFNPVTEALESSQFLDVSQLTTLYGVSYNPHNDKIYVSDAMGFTNTGYIRSYSSSGVFEQNYHVGLNPSKIVFYD